MALMLASVNTPREAGTALAGGADVIDLQGATPDVVRTAVAAIARRRPVCAGDPRIRPDAATVQELASTGIDYLRLGGDDALGCADEVARTASRMKLIAVFFADTPPDASVLPALARNGVAGAMIDTTTGSLLDRIDIAHLLGFVEDCHAAGLLAGFAGSLQPPDIPRLLVLTPDLLGFNDALRQSSGGTSELDPRRLRAVRALIPAETPVAEAPDADYRLLAGAGDVAVDLVFVEDLVLPVFIGAYARERNVAQNVRFAVTASVARSGRTAEDMRDVFSYDLITDGIRMLVGSGHVTFVETLAERIAAMVLRHPRVMRVAVRVEKLETGSGTVGVEIERSRTSARPTGSARMQRFAV